jgi:hypothetical protein
LLAALRFPFFPSSGGGGSGGGIEGVTVADRDEDAMMKWWWFQASQETSRRIFRTYSDRWYLKLQYVKSKENYIHVRDEKIVN